MSDFAATMSVASTKATSPPRAAKILRLAARAGLLSLVVGGYAVGLLAGKLFWSSRHVSHGEPSGSARSTGKHELAEDLESLTLEQSLELADARLHGGDILTAKHLYQRLCADRAKATSVELRYRLALCDELMGAWDEALGGYGAITGPSTSPHVAQLSQLAQARVHLRKNGLDAAKNILCQVLLRADSPSGNGAPQVGDALYALGDILLQQAFAGESSDLLRDEVLALPQFVWSPQSDLVYLTAGPQDQTLSTGGKVDVRDLNQTSDHVESRQLAITVAERILRQALAAHPDHPGASYGHAALGLLTFDQGGRAEALAIYQQLIKRHANQPVQPEAWFNYAKILFGAGRPKEARDAFYRVIDDPCPTHLKGISYLYAGRISLEIGEPQSATREMEQALPLTVGSVYREAAVLALAQAHLAAGTAKEAAHLLKEHRQTSAKTPAAPVEVFLSALAQIQLGGARADLAGNDLIETLSQVSPNDFLGWHGYVMLAQAYEHLGMSRAAAGIYESALKDDIPVDLAHQFTFELARCHHHQGKTKPCQQLLEELAQKASGLWRHRARLELARMTWEEGDQEACLAACRTLLKDVQQDEEKIAVLRLMGQVFQKRQDHYNAALCFSGLVPADQIEAADGEVTRSQGDQ